MFGPPPDPSGVPWSGNPLLLELAKRGDTRCFRKGTVLIEEGELGDTLFIVLSGHVRAFSRGENSRQLTFGTYGPGEYLGEISLDGGPRSASVEAIDTCVCSVVTRRTLQLFIAERPEFAFDLLSKMIRRVRSITISAKQLALNDVYGRVARVLGELAEERPDGTLVAERLTQRDIASRAGCSREMVSRLLKDLETGGYLRVGREIGILKPLPPRW